MLYDLLTFCNSGSIREAIRFTAAAETPSDVASVEKTARLRNTIGSCGRGAGYNRCNVKMNDILYPYLMEGPEESLRLIVKTDPKAVRQQAEWCGVKPGIRMLDVGCGSGKSASILYEMIQPNGSLVAIDRSKDRIEYAEKAYGNKPGLEFLVYDFTQPLKGLERFDLIWVRFILEYFRNNAMDIVRNLTDSLKPGGYLCLLDLDYNCLNHYPLPQAIESVLYQVLERMEKAHNFDPYAGRKLFSYLYELGFEDIEVHLTAHHLIYGKLHHRDHFNWMAKLKMVCRNSKDLLERYPGGQDGFLEDFSRFLNTPGRFIYTPLILVKGKKPDPAHD